MENENIHIGKLLKLYLSKWKIYVPIGLLCLVFAILFILIVPKEYEIKSSLQLRDNSKGMAGELSMLKNSALGGLLGGGSVGGVNVNNEILLITSRQNLGAVIKSNSLQTQIFKRNWLKKVEYEREKSPLQCILPNEVLDTLSKPLELKIEIEAGTIDKLKVKSALFETVTFENISLPASIQIPIGKVILSATNASDGTYFVKVTPFQKVFETLLKHLVVAQEDKTTNMVYLVYESANKPDACKMLNAIMDRYNSYTKDVKIQDSYLNSSFVKKQLDTVVTDLVDLELRMEQFKQTNKIPSPELYGKAIFAESSNLEEIILETQLRLNMLDYVLDYMKNPANTYSAVPMLDESGEKAVAVYNELVLNRQALLLSTEEDNPTMILVDKQLKEQRKILFETISSLRESVKVSFDELTKKKSSIMGLVGKMPTQEREYIEMLRNQKIKEKMFLFLMQKLQEKELVKAPDDYAARVVDSAYTSYKHVFPKGSIVLIVAFLLACILSVSVISVKEFVLKKE